MQPLEHETSAYLYMVCEVSPNFQSFLFQAKLARMQTARLERIAKEFDLLVKSAAVFLGECIP
jgi:hypothetical protein